MRAHWCVSLVCVHYKSNFTNNQALTLDLQAFAKNGVTYTMFYTTDDLHHFFSLFTPYFYP
ncbi:hypothetical protein A9Z65_09840 [Moraxella nonliquefaciens]|nr:hypothetical protein A9Z65_09840 [Moraxella nonliquefaciens]